MISWVCRWRRQWLSADCLWVFRFDISDVIFGADFGCQVYDYFGYYAVGFPSDSWHL